MAETPFFQFRDNESSRYVAVGRNDRRDLVQFRQIVRRKNIPVGIAFGEKPQRRVEPSRNGKRRFGHIRPQSGRCTAGPNRIIPQQQSGIIPPQSLGTNQNRIARSAQPADRRPIFGRGNHSPTVGNIVQKTVGRNRERERYSHDLRFIEVISGHAPNRIG